jgi:hypothetical protein
VALAELVRGVNIALGSGGVSECRRLDRSGDDRIAIDELLEAVANSVSGCPSQRVVRSASSVALSSVRTVLNFGSIGAGGGGGGAAMTSAGARPADSLGGSGQGFGCQTLDCPLGGIEETCCFIDDFTGEDVLEINRQQCRFVDNLNQTVTFDGFFSLVSTELDFHPCSERSPPFGSSFRMLFGNFTGLIEDQSQNFDFTFANFIEEFQAAEQFCAPSQFDPFQFGIRGDGLRFLAGAVQRKVGNNFTGPEYDSTSETGFDGLSLDVILSFGSLDCSVFTDVNGEVSVTDAITHVQSSQGYEDFGIDQEPGGDGTYFLSLDGDLATDCVGRITLETDEALQLPPDAVCPVDGRIFIFSEDEGTTTAVGYTPGGGITFDLDGDGTIEDSRPSCVDLDLRECGMQQQDETCTPCSGGGCGAGLECAECLSCEFPDTRCVPADQFFFCGFDLYGSLDF